ncbi:CRTAC1 family protein [Halococcus agarilyticus]|uniref:CRTAC1 family protein n=1 Tax=Halococcus agarilyticus TaxID=1232219 RepID=UPI0006776108|nr:CRTAC1 family protein [Halococcus agarilyticus]
MRVGPRVIVLVAAVVLAGCLGGASDGAPSNSALSFAAADDAGLAYETTDSGLGNGNDSVYAADYDNDLHTDLLAIGGDDLALFHNTGGSFERSGALPEIAGHVQSALFFDRDTDGWQDLLVLRRNATPVFLENRKGEFHRADVGLDDELAIPVSASAADYTGDGCPDLFVAQYGDWENTTPRAWNAPTTLIEQDNGNPNLLYRGTCADVTNESGGFERATDTGIEGSHWSLATSFVDLNADGRPDIHVANDYYNDTIYYNEGDGTFEKRVLGAETDRNGMSSETADLDGDGRLDLFVTNIYFPENTSALSEQERELFESFVENRLGKRMRGNNVLLGANETNGTNGTDGTNGTNNAGSTSSTGDTTSTTASDAGFTYAGKRLGLYRGGWGWAAAITDFDSDGEQDVFHTTQTVIAFDDSNPRYPTPMTWVQHDGDFYRQSATDIGFESTNGRGVAHLDYDRSGTADLALATYDDRHRLYRNNASQGNSLQVRVKSGSLNHTSLGARVSATAGNDTQLRVNTAKADYQSQDTRFLHFGLGESESVSELRVAWPDGTERVLENVSAGQRIVVTPGGIADRADYRNATG